MQPATERVICFIQTGNTIPGYVISTGRSTRLCFKKRILKYNTPLSLTTLYSARRAQQKPPFSGKEVKSNRFQYRAYLPLWILFLKAKSRYYFQTKRVLFFMHPAGCINISWKTTGFRQLLFLKTCRVPV